MNLIDYFPEHYTPSQQQEDILNQIDRAFSSGKKYVICNAPTGVGKSFLSKTLANSSSNPSDLFIDLITSHDAFKQGLGGEFINAEKCENEPPFGAVALTITKSLQDQYINLFPDGSILKGKRNYQCAVDDRFEVEFAPCIFVNSLKEECLQKNKCPYYNQRKSALINKFSTYNYSMFLSLPEHVKHRQYIICDEASELEDEIVKRFSRTINYKIIEKLLNSTKVPIDDYSKFFQWLNIFLTNVANKVDELQDKLKKKKSKATMTDRQIYSLYKNLHMQIKTTIDTWNDCEYIIEKTKDAITLKPLKVNKLARHLFDFGEKILLMSATIIDPKNFAKSLGILEHEYVYIETNSVFDPKKAPIYISSKVKLNYKNLKDSLPYLKDQIDKICAQHKNEKGVIHTHTHQITEYLQNNLKGTRFLYREAGVNNEDLMKEHSVMGNNTVIVSPSLTFGIDLKDDLARFQIIIKAPYLPLGDERVKRLFKEDPVWYQDKMLTNVIQACGRAVRTKDDFAVTYILDGAILDAIIKNKTKLPSFFLSRFT